MDPILAIVLGLILLALGRRLLEHGTTALGLPSRGAAALAALV